MQFSSRGIRPGLTTMLARHLDKNTMGYLQWRWGTQSSMNTSIVRDTKSSHFTFAVQVSCCFAQTFPDLYAKVFTVLRTYHFFITIAGNSTYIYYDELPVQIPG